MSVVSINSDYSNISDFVNSLFSDGVRTITPIQSAVSNNHFIAPFSDQNDKIKSVLLAAWQASQGDAYNAVDYSHCPELDKPIIGYLANYLKNNQLNLSIPQLELQESSGAPVYKLKSYTTSQLLDTANNWDYNVVGSFLDLLINGAHMVVIQSSTSLPNGPTVVDLWSDFQNDSTINSNERRDTSGAFGTSEVGNSHYASVTNLNGYYYPVVTTDSAPNPCSFILSLLVCVTTANKVKSSTQYESFLQLEGWQLPPDVKNANSSRHSADYDLYKQCYWNISTYGSCAYSEKRGTAVFLAPADWIPVPTPGTFMPPYAGAESPQGWLQEDLVTL